MYVIAVFCKQQKFLINQPNDSVAVNNCIFIYTRGNVTFFWLDLTTEQVESLICNKVDLPTAHLSSIFYLVGQQKFKATAEKINQFIKPTK